MNNSQVSPMASKAREFVVSDLQARGWLLVEDGNHGEYRPRPDEFGTGNWSFIRAADMNGGDVLFDQAQKINDRARARINKGVGAVGDVLLSHKGTVGKVAFVRGDAPPFVCSPQTTFWRSLDPDEIDPRYLYCYLRSPAFQQQLDAREGETDMAPYVSLTAQRQLRLDLPAIDDQRAIANLLGALDDKIALNRRMNRTLEATAAALFRSWFVDFDPVAAKAEGRRAPGVPDAVHEVMPSTFAVANDGPVPTGWQVFPIGWFVEVNPPRHLQKGAAAPYLDMANVPTHGHAPEAWTSRVAGSGQRFVNGDTLLARITPCLENGKTALVDFLGTNEVGWGSTEYIVLRPLEPIPPAFAYCLTRLPEFREHARSSMTGSSGRQRVATDSLMQYPFVRPPGEIARAFGGVVNPIFAKVRGNVNESRKLGQLRDALLPQLLSGAVRLRAAERAVAAAI